MRATVTRGQRPPRLVGKPSPGQRVGDPGKGARASVSTSYPFVIANSRGDQMTDKTSCTVATVLSAVIATASVSLLTAPAVNADNASYLAALKSIGPTRSTRRTASYRWGRMRARRSLRVQA